MPVEINRIQPHAVEFRHEYISNEPFEQWYLLSSDWHWDNPKCDRDLLRRHIDQAKERNAKILVFGDLFCAMQGKYDKRSDKTALRPEHATPTYLDSLVDTAAEWLADDPVAFVSYGNHETSILGRHETDLTARLCDRIGAEVGMYQGWILFRFRQPDGGGRTVRLHYTHGYGGGGPVTKDVIQVNRKAVYLPDADIVVSGHTHDRWIFPVQRLRLKSRSGEQYLQEQLHVKSGNYKDEFTSGMGWAVGKGMPPKALGAVWLRFWWENREMRFSCELTQ